MNCVTCGADLGRVERVGRRDACPRCGVDLHVCRQCRFHDPVLANACREPQAERVVDKVRSNFCDYFEPAEAVRTEVASAADTRAALDRLFARR